MGKMPGTGRPREEEYWGHVTILEGGRRVKCNDCGLEFAASANRIKSHIDKVKGKGIRVCTDKPNSNNDRGHNLLRFHGRIQADDAEDEERIHVGSSFVSNGENEDLLVKRYVCECLRPEEKVFISPSLNLTQKEFITLEPGTCLDSWVIDIFVEILTECEKKKATPSNWYLPVTFSTAALRYNEHELVHFVRSQKFRESYIFDQESPEKVFIPVHDGPNERGHFYLYILHLNNDIIEIWDSLPTIVGETKRAEIKKLLFAMETLFDKRRTFSNYQMEMANDILLPPNEFDCGVFVINYMQQSDNYVKRDSSFQFDSQKEREDLALWLLTNDLNQEKQNLYQKARRHYEQVDSQYGTKRLRVDGVNKHDGLEKDLMGKKFQRYSEQIRGWIKDEVSSIGVWGMGGSGKTALATHIYDKLLEEVDTKVIWVTVSQNSISHLQKVVAGSIKLNISDEFEVTIISRKLFQAFKQMKKRVVIILDDVWDHFFLKEVGFPMSDNRITLILTTRIWDVCQGMDCKENIIEVESLDGKDGLAFFEKFMELHDETSLEVKEIAMDLSYKCRGLPLAIVRIATIMKGKTQASEWNHMLDCLKNLGYGQYEMDKWVLPVLRSSYDFLNNKLQKFFLYCASSTAGSFDDEDADHLIRRFAYESIDETKKLTVEYNEGYNMLDKLKNHSMLERYGDDKWRIHTFLRILAISIAEDTGKILANAYKNLTEIPSDDQWKEDLQKVFLTGNKIETIPDGTRPRCPQLSSLLLDSNEYLNYIPDDFFYNMPVLKTLDLSHTSIESLPESVSSLKCLIALLLSKCVKLSYIPSLRELKRLIALDLSDTAITEAPMGLEALVNLRCLYLLGTGLEMSASFISKLINLEWLELDWITGPGGIQNLEKLEVIVANFWDISVFNTAMSFLNKKCELRSFDLCLVGAGYDCRFSERTRDRSVKRITFARVDLGNGEAILLGDIKELFIENCDQKTGVRDLCKFLSYDQNNNNPHQIELDIECCDDVEYLCCLSGSCPFCSSSQLVGRLDLKYLKDLKDLVSPYAHVSSHESSLFSHLTDLEIWGCHSMERVMTPKLLALLQNLRTIGVRYCEKMKEIVGEDRCDMEHADFDDLTTILHDDHSTLPKLTSLELKDMPQLNYLYRGVLLCPSFQTLFAYDECKQLEPPQIKISSDGCVLPMEKTESGYRYCRQI